MPLSTRAFENFDRPLIYFETTITPYVNFARSLGRNIGFEYISVPSPNGARPIYRSADCVIRHEGGWGLTIARVPADRDRDRDRIRTMSATNGESFRLQLEEYTFSRYKSKCRVGKSFGNGSGGPLSTCFVWGRRADGFGIRRLYGARLLRGAIQGYVSEERWEWKAR